jgi:hypothetical protein
MRLFSALNRITTSQQNAFVEPYSPAGRSERALFLALIAPSNLCFVKHALSATRSGTSSGPAALIPNGRGSYGYSP